MSQFINKDHQSDRHSINLTIPPIFNPQGKSTSIGAIAEGFLSTTKATYSEIYRRYIRRVETYIEENYKQLGIQYYPFMNTKMEQLFQDSCGAKRKG